MLKGLVRLAGGVLSGGAEAAIRIKLSLAEVHPGLGLALELFAQAAHESPALATAWHFLGIASGA